MDSSTELASDTAPLNLGPDAIFARDAGRRIIGPEVARRLQASRPETRILLMSGFPQPILDSGRHLDEGMTLIEKPFSGPMLIEEIARVTERGAAR